MRATCHYGELLTRSEIIEISDKFVLSRHAQLRLHQRFPELNSREKISKNLLNSGLAFFQNDGYISINMFDGRGSWLVCPRTYQIITVREASANHISNFKKWQYNTRPNVNKGR